MLGHEEQQYYEEVQRLHSVWWAAERERRIMAEHLRHYDDSPASASIRMLAGTYRQAAADHLAQLEVVTRAAYRQYELALARLRSPSVVALTPSPG